MKTCQIYFSHDNYFKSGKLQLFRYIQNIFMKMPLVTPVYMCIGATSLDQRNTPTKALGTSLAKKLMPHHTTSLIPTATSIKLLHPKVPSMLKMKRQKSLMITSE